VRFAKYLGANVVAEASPHHFTLTEEDVLEFGTNAKMNPPLRRGTMVSSVPSEVRTVIISLFATSYDIIRSESLSTTIVSGVTKL
ncbi:dihydroorotase, partial [Clostridioides difficile]